MIAEREANKDPFCKKVLESQRAYACSPRGAVPALHGPL